jgi:NAD(P)-dependent dehydrogenase (short-subunit alcohol dehydrogenase family)
MATWIGWRTADMPTLSGRTALVTGASSGIGLVTALHLAEHGARTLLGCRDPGRGARAADFIRERVAGAAVEVVALDLAALDSVREAAAETADRTGHLDLLVNNAGVMAPAPGHTADGFELQLGTNHLGHFALTARLLPLLLAAPQPRVVTVSSVIHLAASGAALSDPADFTTLPRDSRWIGYARSKLANLLFAFELDRRARGAGTGLLSAAAHPGVARSELVHKSSFGGRPLLGAAAQATAPVWAQSTESGALPSLFAATSAAVQPGGFYGPRLTLRGGPTRAQANRAARDEALASRLWEASCAATGIGFEALDRARQA